METVGIRELKNRLSAYVRKVEAGEVVLVTDRGVVVAELVPPGYRVPAGVHPGLLELARRDGLRLPTRVADADSYPPMPLIDPAGESSQQVLDWLREDRR